MQLTVGSVYQGKITGITKFGVFVELEKGTTGLVHISEVAKSFVNDINDFVKVGDEVSVKLLSAENNKIALSIKQALPDDEPARQERPRRPRSPKPIVFDGIKKSKSDEPQTFEDMMAKFKQSSDEKFTDLKRKNGETRRSSRRSSK